MTITRDQPATLAAVGGTTTPIVWSVNPTPGSKVIVAFSVVTLAPTSVSDNGVTPSTFTLDSSISSGTNNKLYFYRADNITLPASGSYTVTANWASASGGVTAWGSSYLGVKAGGPTSNNSGTATSTSVTSNNATPAAAGALYFAAFQDASSLNPETITLTGSGFTEQATETNGASDICMGFADKIDASGPTATACTWTIGDTVNWAAGILAYDAAPTGATQPAATPGRTWKRRFRHHQQPQPFPLPGIASVTATLNGLGTATAQPTIGAGGLAAGFGGKPFTVIQAAPTVQAASLTTATVTLPFATGSQGPSTLVACITTNGTTTNPFVSGLTLGGSADNWQSAVADPGGTDFGGAIWYDPVCAAGQTSVVVNCTGGSGTQPEIYIAVYEVAGVLASDQGSHGDQSGATWTSGTTSNVHNTPEMFFGVVTNSGSVPVVTGVGTWITQSTAAGSFDQVSGYQVSSASTATFSGTVTSGGTTALVATFEALSGALTVTPDIDAPASASGQGGDSAQPTIGAPGTLGGQGTAAVGPAIGGGGVSGGSGSSGSGVIVSVFAVLNGQGTAGAATPLVAWEETATLAGQGTASIVPDIDAPATVGGSGSDTAQPIIGVPASAAGSGGMGGGPAIGAGATASGTGTASSGVIISVSANVIGSGGASGQGGGGGTQGALAGQGTDTAVPDIGVFAVLNGQGTASSGVIISVSAVLSGQGGVGTVTPDLRIVAALAGQGTASSQPDIDAPANVAGQGTANAGLALGGGGSLGGSGSAGSGVIISVSATLAGQGGMGTAGGGTTGALVGQGTATATALVVNPASAILAGTGGVGLAVPIIGVQGALAGASQAQALATIAVLAALAGQGGATGTALAHFPNMRATGVSSVTDPRDGHATVGAAATGTPTVADPRDGKATVTAVATGNSTVTKGGAA